MKVATKQFESKKYNHHVLASDREMVSQEEFFGILFQAVDRALLALGEIARHAIYLHVESNFQIKKEEIPDRIEDFHKVLGSLLGSGTRVVEMLIARNLYKEMGLNFVRRENWRLADHIKYASKQNVVRLATRSDQTDL